MGYKVAAVQLTSSDCVTDNLKQIKHHTSDAAAQGCSLVVLPENFAWLGDDKHNAYQEPSAINGIFAQNLSDLALKYRLTLVAGGIRVADNSNPLKSFNACLVFKPDGRLACQYNKVHLFDAQVSASESYLESGSFTAGNHYLTHQTDRFCLGLSICYDLRFPEQYKALRKAGADILIVPASFTVPTGKAHWHSLLKARAIETQCYVIAAAQTGQNTPNIITYGHSMIVSPWGETLAELTTEPGIVTADFNQTTLREVRQNMPVLDHERPGVLVTE